MKKQQEKVFLIKFPSLIKGENYNGAEDESLGVEPNKPFKRLEKKMGFFGVF